MNPRISEDSSERRAAGRRLQQLHSSIGPVLDISATGVRVIASRKLSRRQKIVLFAIGGKVKVAANVAWSKRIGFRRHEVGLEFVDLDADLVASLAEVATAHAYVRAA